MNLTIAIAAIGVTFAAIRTLNREVRPHRSDIGPVRSIAIAALVLACIHGGAYAKAKYLDPHGLDPIIHVLVAVSFLLLLLQLVKTVFRLLLGVPSLDRDIHICFGGDIEEDRAFAADLLSSLSRSAPASVHLFDIHECERRQDAYQPSGAAGTFIYVISEEFVRDDEVRSKLLITGQKADIPGYMYFYICRGTKYENLRRTYPEMEELGDRVMIGDDQKDDEKDDPVRNLLEQVVAHALRRPLIMRRLRRLMAMCFLPSHAGVLAGVFIPWLYASAPFVWLLMVMAFFSPGIAERLPNAILAIGVCQYVSLLLYRQRALDFWPFLGSRLNFDLSQCPHSGAGTWNRRSLSFQEWVNGTRARRHLGDHAQSLLDAEQSTRSVRSWSGLVLESRLYTLLVICGGGLAVTLFSIQARGALSWMLPGVTVGMLYSPWVAWSQRFVRRIGYWRLGLMSEELNRTESFFRVQTLGRDFGINLSYRSHKVHRSWLPEKPRVFISYSWASDEKRSLAPTLHRILTELGIDHFYDKESIRSEFASWRASVSDALMNCTHVILLLDDAMPTHQVVDREIRTAVQRLHTEVFPSFICVAEPQTMEFLLSKEDVPFEFRWLLEWAPCISPRQARQESLLNTVITQRSRQGRARDFITLLFPDAYLKNLREHHTAGSRG